MWFDKIKLMAQIIGFICIGLLAIYGGVVAATGGPPAWAAGAAAPGAITPPYISYQGTLRDASDNLANGTYNMEVAICQNADGSGQIWSETHNNVEVREGHFNLLLGESAALSREDFVDPSLYVELTVDGQVMTPRQRFAAVPYAISATYATKLSAPDGDPAEAVTVDNAGNVSVGDGSASADVEIPMGGLCIDSDGACGSPGDGGLRVGDGGIHGTDSSSDDLYLVPSTGKVGIGTTNPTNKLQVAGQAWVTDTLIVGQSTGTGNLTVHSETAPGISLDTNGGSDEWLIRSNGEHFEIVEDDETGDPVHFTIRNDNKVGIGTTDPQAKLDVNGNIAWSGHLASMNRTSYYDAESNHEGDVYTQMVEKTANSLCYLGTVKFRELDSAGESGLCDIGYFDGYWQLHVYAVGDSYAKCRAWCLEW